MSQRRSSEVSLTNQPEVPFDAILSFLKDTRGAVTWSAKDLRDCLKLDAKQVQQTIPILEMQGYVAKEGDQWLTTSAGESISKSKRPQFSLESVNKTLDTLKDRIEAVNRDKRSEFKITKAVAFGDFLSERAQVQAADVGIELSRRDTAFAEELEEKRARFITELRRKSRLLTMQKYRPWMGQRTHRDLV